MGLLDRLWPSQAQNATPAPQGSRQAVKGPAAGLIALIGLTAATYLLQITPENESGRKVEVHVTENGDVDVEHLVGPQFLDAYLDIAGVATACDGLTTYHGKPIKPGQHFTEQECIVMLIEELTIKARGVMACTPALRRPGMDFAIVGAVDFAYNLGVAAWCGSTAHRYLEAGDQVRAANNLLPWNKARVGAANVAKYRARGETCAQSRGVWRCTVRGLTLRRHRDREYMLTGTPGYPVSTLNRRVQQWK